MARAPHIARAALVAFLCVAPVALAQDEVDGADLPLSVTVAGSRSHVVGSDPQTLTISAVSGSSPVAGAKLGLELVGAPGGAYCTCGEATALDDGTFAIEWGSAEPGAMTLRVDAEAEGHLSTTGQFALTAAQADSAPARASLWIPPAMLEGRTYEGIVVTEDAHAQGARILITSSDPAALAVEREATVQAGDNHAIFELRPLAAGRDAVGVFASINGPLVSAESRIYSQKSVPSRLEVILASNRTMSGSVTAYVFALDSNGTPTRVPAETTVRLESDSALVSPAEAVIPEDEFHARFALRVYGNGTLRAHTGGLESASAEIAKVTRDVDISMEVAPSPAGESSHATYHAWLEEGGRPYAHPGVLVGNVHTDNTAVAGFLPVASENSEHAALYMRNGVASGLVYTRGAGVATITVSVPDVGTATGRIVVGSAYLDNIGDLGGLAAMSDVNIEPVPAACATARPDANVNSIRAWVHPLVTSGAASIMISPYHDTDARGACASSIGEMEGTSADIACGDGREAEGACFTLRHPMEVDGRRVSLSVSPPGTEYDATVELTQGTIRSFAASYGIVAHDVGNYTLAATATNVGTSLANFSAIPPNSGEYELHIEPLRIAPGGGVQDIALVSIHDADGTLIDARGAFGRPKEVTVAGDGLVERTLMIVDDSARLRADLGVGTTITATAQGLGRGTAEISLPGTVAGVALDIPPRVHLHEEFPFAMHLVDSLGTPLSTVDSTEIAASGIEAYWDTHRMSAQRAGEITMSVLADHGAHERSISVFSNVLGLDVRASAATARTGVPFRIDVITAADDIDIDVSSTIPWAQVGDSPSIDVTADVPGTFPVTISASKRGYEPSHETIHVTAEEYALLDVSAAGTDGERLAIEGVRLVAHAHDSGTTESTIALPWSREYGNIASVEIQFPHEHGGGYVLSGTTVNGREYGGDSVHFSASGDMVVRAVYEGSVTVSATRGVSGAGVHAYGTSVELVAEPTEIVPFLAYSVFERWDALPDSATHEDNIARFVASGDTEVHASYRQDYSGALAMALATMAALVIWRRLRHTGGVSPLWALGELVRRARTRYAPQRR